MASKKYLVGLDLNKNELQNAVIQNLATAPSTPLAGQIYYNTSDETLYFYDGSAWVNFVQVTQVQYGLFSNRPAAGSVPAGTLYYATDNHLLYLSDGSNWSQISQFGSVSSQTSYGDTSSNGTSTDYARADHTHGTPSLSTATPQSLTIGGTGSAGSGTLPSKDDHVHAMPAFGVVTAQTTFGASSSDGSASSVAHSDHTHGTPAHNNAAHNAINISALTVPTADVSWGSYKITSLATPTADTDAANKAYVDTVAQGLNIHDPVAAATTTTLAVTTGGTVTYNNGTSGVGATLTLSVALTVLDGYTLATGDRVIIKNEATSANNGVYTINSAKTVLTRATDADTTAELNGGDFFFVQNGTVNDNTGWVIVDKVTTIGTTPVVFSQFSGAGTYQAGNGLSLTGNTFAAVADTGISVSGSGIAIDTSVVVTKYAANVGDGTNTSYTVTHNLGTKDVIVSLYDNSSPYAEVVADIQHTSTTAITLVFSTAPTSNQYRVVVHG
jgi:hypothetical protein